MKVHRDHRGELVVDELPFDARRIFFIRNVPPGESRGGHAHRTCWQRIVAVVGSFDVVVDGVRHHLNTLQNGFTISPEARRVLENFSSGAVCMVVCSEHYDPEDYIR